MELASKSSLYQGALRTPSVARWKGTIKAQVREELVSNIDIAPTILDACGARRLPNMPIDGMSYLEIARGETPATWRDAIYAEIAFTRAVVTKDWKYLAFRLPPSQIPTKEEGLRLQKDELEKIKSQHSWVTWELDPKAKISHIGGPPGGSFLIRLTMAAKPPYLPNYFDEDQLYHIADDPTETTNLATHPEKAAELQKMKSIMKSFLDDLPGTFADLKPEPQPIK